MGDSNNSAPQFSHRVIVGAPHLMNMQYTPAELAQELKISARTIRDWTHGTLPHTKDDAGRLWINGIEFAAWVANLRANRRKTELRAGEAYCLKCKSAVEIQGVQKSMVGKTTILMGRCPTCGSVVNRGMASDQSR